MPKAVHESIIDSTSQLPNSDGVTEISPSFGVSFNRVISPFIRTCSTLQQTQLKDHIVYNKREMALSPALYFPSAGGATEDHAPVKHSGTDILYEAVLC